jgi:hypothetical protein
MATNPATNLTLSRSLYSLSLSWTASTTPGASYILFRGLSASCLTRIGTTDSTSFVDATVRNGVTYFYYVVATLAGVESVPSNIASLTYVGPPGAARNPDEGEHVRQKAELAVGYGVVRAGGGEGIRLQRLKGHLAVCGK